MALIAVPFAFMTGNRGAMAGVGVSIGMLLFAVMTMAAEPSPSEIEPGGQGEALT